MNNVLENVVATIIVTVLSTATGLILQTFGFSTQESISIAGIVLFALVILFLATRKFYSKYIKWLTEQLLESALKVNPNEIDETRTAFRKKIKDRVYREFSIDELKVGIPLGELKQNISFREFPSQEACETEMAEAFRSARKIKILTIRGEKYFLGARSLFYRTYLEKRTKNFNIEVLVLSPESKHITDDLADDLGQASAEEIRGKMQNVLKILSSLANQKNFQVRCYDETPIFKMLMFDNIMFVSAFTEPKNDQNAKMFQITRKENPLFLGLEKHFNKLWERSVPPQ